MNEQQTQELMDIYLDQLNSYEKEKKFFENMPYVSNDPKEQQEEIQGITKVIADLDRFIRMIKMKIQALQTYKNETAT